MSDIAVLFLGTATGIVVIPGFMRTAGRCVNSSVKKVVRSNLLKPSQVELTLFARPKCLLEG